MTAGFIAEWALLQSLIHGARPEDRLVAVAMPVAVTVVALTGRTGAAHLRQGLRHRVPGAPPVRRGGRCARESGVDHAAGDAGRRRRSLAARPGPGCWPRRPCRSGQGWMEWAGSKPGGARAVRRRCAAGPRRPLGLGGARGRPGRCRLLAAARRRPRRSGGAGVGLRGSPGRPSHAVHRDLVRRAVGPGLRRRAYDPNATSRSPTPASPGTSSSAWSSASGSTTSWRNGLPADDQARRPGGIWRRRLQNGSIHRYLGYSFVALVAVLVLVAL